MSPPGSESPDDSDSSSNGNDGRNERIERDLVKQFLANHKILFDRTRKDDVITITGSREEISGFERHSHYAEFLNGKSIDDVTNKLNVTDADMSFYTVVTSYMFETSLSHLNDLSRLARCKLNSFSQDITTLKPFKRVQQLSTLQKYIRTFVQFIGFVVNNRDTKAFHLLARYASL